MNITLLDGQNVPVQEITFDTETYHFTYNGDDITDNIRHTDKQAFFPQFDQATDNLRVYNERYTAEHGHAPAPTGSTSTLGIFADQIINDPLGAPIETLNRTVDKITSASGVKTIALVGVGIIALIIFLRK